MQLIKKIYFGLDFSWWKVLVYAVVLGVACGLMLMVPAFEDTSLHNFGVTPEAWLLLGLPICTNARKPWQAGLKLFMFFLISQPLVYLVQWSVYQGFPWQYYSYWFKVTLACLPAGFVAWYLRRGDMWSALIVALACIVEAAFGANCLHVMLSQFPNQLFAVVLCFAQVPLYILVFLPHARERVAAAAVTLAATVVICLAFNVFGVEGSCGYGLDDAQHYTYSLADTSFCEISETDDNSFTVHATGSGSTVLTATKDDGSVLHFDITVSNDGYVDIVPQEAMEE